MDEGKPVTYELRAIEGLMEICDRSRTEPGDTALRMELLGALGLDPWPLRLPSGEGQVIDLRVDDELVGVALTSGAVDQRLFVEVVGRGRIVRVHVPGQQLLS